MGGAKAGPNQTVGHGWAVLGPWVEGAKERFMNQRPVSDRFTDTDVMMLSGRHPEVPSRWQELVASMINVPTGPVHH